MCNEMKRQVKNCEVYHIVNGRPTLTIVLAGTGDPPSLEQGMMEYVETTLFAGMVDPGYECIVLIV
jgi:hypothetical protein